MSKKYKWDIHIKFDVPWLFLSESVVYSLPLFISFFEDHNISKVLWEKLSNFKSVVLEKFVVNI